MTTLSVVVAFQRSDSMLHRLIAALLDESSRGVEIIVVGEWGAGTREPGVQHVAVPLETPMHVRRNLGLALATGDILCMTDPDVMPRRGWLGAGVSLMAAGWSCAAGPVTSADAAFWGAYVDRCNTGRTGGEQVLSRASGGHQGHMVPTTANVFLDAELYQEVGGFSRGEGDRQWFERILEAGYPILCTPRLVVRHHRHQGWSRPTQDHSSRGRPPFGHSRFSRRRVC